MQKPNDPRDTLKQLNNAAQRQNKQFVASLLVSVAILMKRQGLDKIDISPEELATLPVGSTLHPTQSLNGGIAFEFFANQPEPAARLAAPNPCLKPAKKARRK